MATGNVQPKADQPRVTTESLKRGEKGPSLQYRVQGVKSFDRPAKTRDLSRSVRGSSILFSPFWRISSGS